MNRPLATPIRGPVAATLPVAAAALLLATALAAAQTPATTIVDKGEFRTTSSGRVVGNETFSIERYGDSVVVMARVNVLMPGDQGTDTLRKQIASAADAFDYGLKTYSAIQKFRGQTLKRGVVVADTTFTSYREGRTSGEGSTFTLPPGRVFVLDPHVFTNFNVVCLNLRNRVFKQRPVTMIYLGPAPDTVIVATATDLGPETIRWGGRAVPARHLTLGDSLVTYDLWMKPDGGMLRLEHAPTGLRVERVAPVIRPRRPRPKPAG
jgi:hypothetical protein